jgi:hypothetical protein
MMKSRKRSSTAMRSAQFGRSSSHNARYCLIHHV